MKPCSEDLDRHEMSLILKENMIHYEGIGLSANQIGIGERVFVMMLNMEIEETITCFNPRIIKRYDDDVWFEEGCLSFPDEIINIQRPNRIVVKYEDEDKKDHKIKLDGLAARVFLHEFDHLEGIVFTER
jgi:peptide deformylase